MYWVSLAGQGSFAVGRAQIFVGRVSGAAAWVLQPAFRAGGAENCGPRAGVWLNVEKEGASRLKRVMGWVSVGPRESP